MYEIIWRSKWLTDSCETLEQMAEIYEMTAKYLREMDEDGVKLEGRVEDDYGFLVTEDLKVAEKYNMYLREEGE